TRRQVVEPSHECFPVAHHLLLLPLQLWLDRVEKIVVERASDQAVHRVDHAEWPVDRRFVDYVARRRHEERRKPEGLRMQRCRQGRLTSHCSPPQTST